MSSHFRTCLRFLIKSSLLCGIIFVVLPLQAASLDDLLAHRAVYDLQLERAADKIGISQLNGRMVYEFSGSRCEGFTTRFRYASRIELEESAPRLIDQQTILFETADGNELHVSNKNYVNRELTDEFEAVVRQNGTAGKEGIIVTVTKPEAKIHYLPPALFPLAQMLETLRKAEEGEKFYQTALYNDFEKGDKITQASVVVGALRNISQDETVRPITISHFDDEKNPDGLPNYTSRFLLDRRGVSTDLVFDYGDYSMRGNLTQLELLEQSPCPD